MYRADEASGSPSGSVKAILNSNSTRTCLPPRFSDAFFKPQNGLLAYPLKSTHKRKNGLPPTFSSTLKGMKQCMGRAGKAPGSPSGSVKAILNSFLTLACLPLCFSDTFFKPKNSLLANPQKTPTNAKMGYHQHFRQPERA